MKWVATRPSASLKNTYGNLAQVLPNVGNAEAKNVENVPWGIVPEKDLTGATQNTHASLNFVPWKTKTRSEKDSHFFLFFVNSAGEYRGVPSELSH